MTQKSAPDLHLCDMRTWIPTLHAGDRVLLSGTVYTARDAVHKRWAALNEEGQPLPVSFENAAIYYAGPTPAPDGLPIGSCGPTTSSRMDAYYPALARQGLLVTIGKGDRSEEVRTSIQQTGGIYFCAIGGAGALCAAHIRSARVVAYHELGCESVKELELCRMPLYVGIDSFGHSIFEREGVSEE